MGLGPEVRWEVQWHPGGGGGVRRIMLTRRGWRLAVGVAVLAVVAIVALLALLPLGLGAVLGRVTAGAAQRQNLALHHEHEMLREATQELAARVHLLLGRSRRLAWALASDREAVAGGGLDVPSPGATDDELVGWLRDRSERLTELGSMLAGLRRAGDCTIQALPTGSPVSVARAVPVAGYGWRVSPFTNKEEPHYGVTLAAPVGEPVVSPGGGRVAYAGLPRERQVNEWARFGNLVVLDHGCGVYSVLAHLQSITVRVGRTVVRGEQVGTVGTTGWTRVPALYYEIRWPLASESRPIDPALVDLALPLPSPSERVNDPTAQLPDGFALLRHLRGFR